jgi:Clp amino terminal domain, pathogenicity island component
MFERFTDRARRAVVLSQQEARRLDHNYIGTEHLLLGLVREGEGVAARALEALGVSLDGVRGQVEEVIGRGPEPPGGHVPFTPRAKKVLELSLREAKGLGHDYIGTEHILLGLVREGEGVAAQVLVRLGADLPRVRQQVVELLSDKPAGEAGVGRMVREPRPTVVGGAGVFGEREPPDLVRVVPLAREVVSRSGYRLVLMSLEVWSGWLDLRYALVAAVPLRAYPLEGVRHRWRLSDDLGTPYELVGATSGAGRVVHLHQLSFQPAPPPAAGSLTLTLTDEQEAELATVEVPLGGDAAAEPGAPA